MKLSEMKQILEQDDIVLTKSLGQNFLHDGNQLRRIVDAAELVPTDRVLEIGPGLGPLTELLLAAAGEVLAIEKDQRLVNVLGGRLGGPQAQPTGKLRLLHDDALAFLQDNPRDWSGWKLVANLPYSVASPILVELAQSRRGPERMVATLQLEVARRLMAGPDHKDYGVLTLLLRMDYEPVGWFKIPAGCFFPEPDVDSACVCLRRKSGPQIPPELQKTFTKLVKRSFSQRRKMMLKLLKLDWPAPVLEHAFEQVALPLQARAENASPEQFIRLAELLAPNSNRE